MPHPHPLPPISRQGRIQQFSKRGGGGGGGGHQLLINEIQAWVTASICDLWYSQVGWVQEGDAWKLLVAIRSKCNLNAIII